MNWKPGRNDTGYLVHTIFKVMWPLPCDCYILKFPEGSHVPPHKDRIDNPALENKRHFRLNIVLQPAEEGGEFRCQQAYINFPRLKLFRPDINTHRVDRIKKGTRYVLSIGCAI